MTPDYITPTDVHRAASIARTVQLRTPREVRVVLEEKYGMMFALVLVRHDEWRVLAQSDGCRTEAVALTSLEERVKQ